MTEQEWLASDDPAAMLEYLQLWEGMSDPPVAGNRKMRLFLQAVTGTPGEHWTGRDWTTRFAFAMHSTYIRNNPGAAHLLREIVGNPYRFPPLVHRDGHLHALKELRQLRHHGHLLGNEAIYERADWLTPTVLGIAQAAYEEHGPQQCRLCRGQGHIFFDGRGPLPPNQYRWPPAEPIRKPPPPIKQVCPKCDGNGRIDDNPLDAHRLAVLADALEDAGCDNAEILNHLRGKEQCPKCRGEGFLRTPGSVWGPTMPCKDKATPNPADWPSGVGCDGTGLIAKRSPCVRGCWVLDLLLGKEQG